MTHTLGHSESVEADGPLDTSGSKNPLQQYKSTRTYLKKEAYCAITGIASADNDDDGNLSGNDFIDSDQVKELTKLLNETSSNVEKFLETAGAETIDTIVKSKYKMLHNLLIRKKAKS